MRFYSSFQAADKLGVTVKTIQRWNKAGKFLPAHKTLGGHARYSETQIEDAINGKFGDDKVSQLLS